MPQNSNLQKMWSFIYEAREKKKTKQNSFLEIQVFPLCSLWFIGKEQVPFSCISSCLCVGFYTSDCSH